MPSWTNPFNNSLVPTTTSSVVSYSVTSTPFLLSWAWTGEDNPIAYNTILTTSTSSNVVRMPPVASGTIGFATFIWNKSTTDSLALQDSAGNSLGTLPVLSITQVVLLATATEQASNWAVIKLNVTVASIVDPSTIAGQGLSVSGGLLYVDWNYTEVNLANSPTVSPWSISTWTANSLYVFRFTPGTVILPAAGGGDVGKMNIFKNLTNGTIYIQVPNGSYQIDINITIQSATVIGSGVSVISLLPNEAVGINYCGQVTLLTPSTKLMYSVVTKVNSTAALIQQSTIPLPTTPPVSQPVVLDVSTTVADVVFITDADPALPADGGYTYLVPYPIPKVYYFAMQTVNDDVDVTINFGTVSADTSISITPSIGLIACYVATDGVVSIANNSGGSSYALASQPQVDAGISPNTIVSPLTLQGKYPDIHDNKSTHTVEVIGAGGLSVTGSASIPTLAVRSIITTPATNNTNPSAQAVLSDFTGGVIPRANFNRINAGIGGPTYTILASDSFSLLKCASPCTYTFPDASTFPAGFTVCIDSAVSGTIALLTDSSAAVDSVGLNGSSIRVNVIEARGTYWIVNGQDQYSYILSKKIITYGGTVAFTGGIGTVMLGESFTNIMDGALAIIHGNNVGSDWIVNADTVGLLQVNLYLNTNTTAPFDVSVICFGY